MGKAKKSPDEMTFLEPSRRPAKRLWVLFRGHLRRGHPRLDVQPGYLQGPSPGRSPSFSEKA